jgi:soluble lytic murein transglycosylase-like protein
VLFKARAVAVWSVLIFSLLSVSLLVSSPQPTAGLLVRPQVAARRQLSPPDNLYASAAEALRKGNLQEARQQLDAVAVKHPDQAARAKVVAGLYAYQGGDLAGAQSLLAAAASPGGPGGELEDWRLYLLAGSAGRRGEYELAWTTYSRLIAEHPGSPLRPVASLEAAELAAGHNQPQLALSVLEAARKREAHGKVAQQIDELAWKIGRQLEDQRLGRAAGLRILVEDPLSATAMQVLHSFRAPDGAVDWNRLLSPQDVVRRAESFLTDDNPRAAGLTLDQVPEAQRDFRWHLLRARTLARGGGGRQALTLLATLQPTTARERAALVGERLVVLAESGQSEAAAAPLAELVRSNTSLPLATNALHRLYKDFSAAGLFAPAMDSLRLLRRVDPQDHTGAADLWERGWREYQRNDPAQAVSYWSVLTEIYPEDGDAQRGRYWQARALETLGRQEEASQIYRRMAALADTGDFYYRQALTRLDGTVAAASSPSTSTVAVAAPAPELLAQAPAAGAWPQEPELRRAKLLIDLGLDQLASRELELAAEGANPRDVLALKALILCRKGDQRSGLVLLREAYPALGTAYQAGVPSELLFAYYPLTYGDEIRACARETGLPGNLIAGIIRQESAFDPRATSPVGARGLMQLMPDTAREMSRKAGFAYSPARLYDPTTSVHLGATYFRELLDDFGGNVELALAGYNGGPNRIQRLWTESGPNPRLDDFLETLSLDESRNYVKRILVLADSYRQLYPSLG